MIFINIRGVPAAFWEETPFSGVSAIYRSDIVALRHSSTQPTTVTRVTILQNIYLELAM